MSLSWEEGAPPVLQWSSRDATELAHSQPWNVGKERGDSKGEKVQNTGMETRPIPQRLSYHNSIT